MGDYPEISDDFGHWLAGFIDGEGCFTIERRNRSGFACRFFIGLRDDDEPVLHEIAARLGMGSMRYTPRQGAAGGQVRWTLNNSRDCARLVEILDRFPLRAKKARDYLIWREAVCYLLGRRPWARVGWGPMPTLKQRLTDLRRYDAPAARPELATPPALWED